MKSNKRRLSGSENSTGQKYADKTTQIKTITTLKEKGRMTLRMEP